MQYFIKAEEEREVSRYFRIILDRRARDRMIVIGTINLDLDYPPPPSTPEAVQHGRRYPGTFGAFPSLRVRLVRATCLLGFRSRGFDFFGF